MVKAVLFDLDGTLLNRDESVKRFIENQYERLNKWISHIPKSKYISRFIELDNHGYVWKDKVYQQLTQEFHITGLTSEDLLQDYLSGFKNHCIPFAHHTQMMEELKSKNLLLGMITNGYGQFQLDTIKALGIEQYFDVILVSEWEGIKKPDPLLFTRALERLHVSPNQSVFVGDHPENDVKAAQNIGMKAVWKKDCHWDYAEADFIVNDLAEIPLIIRNLSGQSTEF
ncbi:HAD family hydrolase [Neobacillus jeddahensis]|uniref:HAD family hydrolase n=1 Tax=Neobacillus jeddahensis TaxID=1461580 RepID=UPI00058D3ED0|nr:HAD-IA family hydrolase [Neobacillus jeddahensis]